MAVEDPHKTLYLVCCSFNMAFFACLVIAQTAVMCRIKKLSLLDRSAIVTLATYSCCLLLRLLDWVEYLRTG